MEGSAADPLSLRDPTAPFTLATPCLGLGSSNSTHSTQTGDGEAEAGLLLRRRPGRPPKTKACQVCGLLLTDLPAYHQRYRICVAHRDAPSVVLRGVDSRFCQQCGAFHPVSKFNGTRRSCRDRLRKHAIRRRKSTDGADGARPESWHWDEQQETGGSDGDTADPGSSPSKRRKAAAESNSTDASGCTPAGAVGRLHADDGVSGGTFEQASPAWQPVPAATSAPMLAPAGTQEAGAWPWQDYWPPPPAAATTALVHTAPQMAALAQQQQLQVPLQLQQQQAVQQQQQAVQPRQAARLSRSSLPSTVPHAAAEHAVPPGTCCDPLAALLAAAAVQAEQEQLQTQQQQQQHQQMQEQLQQQLQQQRVAAAAATAAAPCAVPAVCLPALQGLPGAGGLPTTVLEAALAALQQQQQQQQLQQQAQLLATLAGLPPLPPAHLALLMQALQQPGTLQALQAQSRPLAALLLTPAPPPLLSALAIQSPPVTPAAWQHANPGFKKEQPFAAAAPAPPQQPIVRVSLSTAPVQAETGAQAGGMGIFSAAGEAAAPTVTLAGVSIAAVPAGRVVVPGAARTWGGFPVTTGFT